MNLLTPGDFVVITGAHYYRGKKAEITRLAETGEPGDICVRIHGRGISNDHRYLLDLEDVKPIDR